MGEGKENKYLDRKNRRFGKGQKIWLPAKRKIAEALGYDPDSVSAEQLRTIESRFRVQNGVAPS